MLTCWSWGTADRPHLLGKGGASPTSAASSALTDPAARAALVGPAARLGVDYEEKAARQVVSESASYPYFIQEYGLELWNHAEQSPIGLADLETVREIATDSVCSSVSAARIAPARAGLLPSRPALRLLA